MCCVVACLFAIGPRAAIVAWWLIDPARWALAFDSAIVPIAGFLVAPWTTLMYVAVFPGGVEGIDVLWIGIGIALDASSWFGGYSNRNRAFS